MKLTKFRVTHFQSVIDSNVVDVGDITCLVGKNEAGKTALLTALSRLNPINGQSGTYSVTDDYPRRDVEDYRNDVEDKKTSPATVIQAFFELSDSDLKSVIELVGAKAVKGKILELNKGYKNERTFVFPILEKEAIFHIAQKFELLEELRTKVRACNTIAELNTVLSEAEQTEAVAALSAVIKPMLGNSIDHYLYNTFIREKVPHFLYFDEYYQMKGRDNIEQLMQRRDSETLLKTDYPLLGLINLARLDLETLLKPGRTQELKNRLEGAGNHLSKNIIKYWSQNKHLQMKFDVREAQPNDPQGMTSGTNIWGEVYDSKHWVSTGLDTRSKGFVWFFSFLAWYSDVKRDNENLILLLDEPGLSLHARAQEDLLRYFDAEIRNVHQLVYTTHSPFMVDVHNFQEVRIVQDRTIDTDEDLPIEKQGTKVTTDVLDASEDSLFPLQGALGYDLYQTLFVGPNSLVVEGVSDLLYLQAFSAILEAKALGGLDGRWTITPTGGADKVPTFVALIGASSKLNVAVLIDFQKKDKQWIDNLYKSRLLTKKKVNTFADFTGTKEADIEDMIDIDVYLDLVSKEYAKSLPNGVKSSDLKSQHPRLLVRLEEYFSDNGIQIADYNHFRVARLFASTVGDYESKISKACLDRFQKCFAAINALL